MELKWIWIPALETVLSVLKYGFRRYLPSTPPLILCSDEKEEYIKHVWYWENKRTLIYERIVTYMNLVIYPADQVSRSHFSNSPSAKPCNFDGAPSSEVAYTMYACLVQTLLKFWENLQII
ncbi:uncharacterized protein EAE97_009719 [Botrytis byssoidea]|uniref:Uncharacterized protein n=1 Tax=Botrytis byssoidea TaxID=139641 RepID=A0A9P5I8X4_9HELO|nr:uncharacterized protein EAE97_009719 [Botrytis byssoidea]KAF7928877.1 hypothetical protein EAE97_009719 [Botrytis byssoidea]